MVAVGNDTLWRRFASLLGLAELADDPRFATNPQRVANRTELISIIEAALAAKGSAAWAEELSRVGIPAGAINSIDAALVHPQVAARDMVLTHRASDRRHPAHGRVADQAFRVHDHRPASAADARGAHRRSAPASSGTRPTDIAAMREAGVVR